MKVSCGSYCSYTVLLLPNVLSEIHVSVHCFYTFCFPIFQRREESLPIFKRRLLGGLLDFAARELQAQVTPVLSY